MKQFAPIRSSLPNNKRHGWCIQQMKRAIMSAPVVAIWSQHNSILIQTHRQTDGQRHKCGHPTCWHALRLTHAQTSVHAHTKSQFLLFSARPTCVRAGCGGRDGDGCCWHRCCRRRRTRLAVVVDVFPSLLFEL